MAERVSVYLDDITYKKLVDIKRVRETLPLISESISKVVAYCIIKTWQAEFVDRLNTDNWDEELRAVVEQYASSSGGNGRDEQ